MFTSLKQYCESCISKFGDVSSQRKIQLKELTDYITDLVSKQQQIKLVFICTHNSRRSHMAQLWASAAANYYNISRINTFSGGTEATAFNPRALEALQWSGFKADLLTENDNPRYRISYAPDAPALIAFSKKFDDLVNPSRDFAAIMTCSQADSDCPIVRGASIRVSLPNEDPKNADSLPQETEVYNRRNRQIATEMLYCFYIVTLRKWAIKQMPQ